MTETGAQDFDVVVVGGGPGGYVAAIRAAQLGLKTACIEGRGRLGGTCLNVGCIPSKALLHASEQVEHARHSFGEWGINVGEVQVDLGKMMSKKDEVVHGLTSGIELLLAKNKVTYIKGWATLQGEGAISIASDEGGETSAVTAKNIILATGSEVAPLRGVEIDEKRIVSSTGALELDKIPEHLVVVGGGVIGLEMGSVWQRLGAKVTVVEFLDRICPGMDNEIAKTFQKTLEAQGMDFKLGHKVSSAEVAGDHVHVTIEPSAGGAAETMNADVVLVAIGRRPFTQGLGLEAAGVELDDKGRVAVDGGFKTSAKGIFAIGDVIDGPMLAHKAEKEGVLVAELISGKKGKMDYNKVPGIVYTAPEVANIGFAEQDLKEAGVSYKAGKFPFKANSRARAMEETDGLVKILAHKDSGRILGAHIIGADAGTLIHEVAAVMEFGGTYEDLIHIIHGHPTLNEAVKEAAMAIDKRAIHV